MGSPPLRSLAVLVLALAVAVAVPAQAQADDAADARQAAETFLDALVHADAAAVCSLFTAEAVERVGGPESCLEMFEPSGGLEGGDALDTLQRGFTASRKSSAKRKGQYVTKKFNHRALADAIERLDSELTVKLGRSPRAAAGQLATTVILDTRSTARRLVLYAESDDGSIWRLTASARGRASFERVAVGVPEAGESAPPPPMVLTAVESVTFDTDGRAFARLTLSVVERGKTYTFVVYLVLVRRDSGYLVDDFLYSVLFDLG